VLNMPEVDYVEADQEVHADQACTTQLLTPSWGLDRIAEIDIDLLDSRFPYATNAGEGVDVYIIDTGVYPAHSDFGARVTWGFNSIDTNNQDCNGHGTHVAGTVAGTLFGVAKQADIIAVKVLNCGGSGTTATVVAGVNWVATQHTARGKPSVSNMSLGGGYSAVSNAAVAAAVSVGAVFVVAAGNSNADACNFSPASEPTAITVGSTALGSDPNGNSIDSRSTFSNVGTCVDVFSPGSIITSAWIGSPTARNTISGTSMAAPHVAGIATTILTAQPTLTPAEVAHQISETASKDLIALNCGNSAVCNASPNLLSFIGC